MIQRDRSRIKQSWRLTRDSFLRCCLIRTPNQRDFIDNFFKANKAFLILPLCLQCYNTCLLSPRSLHCNSLENIFMSPIKHPSYLSRVSYFVSGDIRNNKYEVCQPAQPAYQAQTVGLFVPNKPIINPLNFLTHHFAAFH